jgi:hypothetical protein
MQGFMILICAGTQWNEFYWKEQTVMLLMQEADFPEGKNPEFCARSLSYPDQRTVCLRC